MSEDNCAPRPPASQDSIDIEHQRYDAMEPRPPAPQEGPSPPAPMPTVTKAGVYAAIKGMTTDAEREEWGISEDRPIYLCIVRAIAGRCDALPSLPDRTAGDLQNSEWATDLRTRGRIDPAALKAQQSKERPSPPAHQHEHQAQQFWREVRDVDGVRWFWIERCVCGDEVISQDSGPLSALPSPPAQEGTFACPICGVEGIHAHGEGDVFDWLDAQASRFGYRLAKRRWGLRHDDDRDSATYRVDHCLKRLGDADFKDFMATPMGRYFAEVFRQVRPVVEQSELLVPSTPAQELKPMDEQQHCENCGAVGVELQELMCRSCWEQEPEGPRFHWRDGVYFQRVDQGAVLMTLPQLWKLIPANEWASIVTHVAVPSPPVADAHWTELAAVDIRRRAASLRDRNHRGDRAIASLFDDLANDMWRGTISPPVADSLTPPRKPYEDIYLTPFEVFGHNEWCAKWKDFPESIQLDPCTACTCGGQEAHPDGPSAPSAPAAAEGQKTITTI